PIVLLFAFFVSACAPESGPIANEASTAAVSAPSSSPLSTPTSVSTLGWRIDRSTAGGSVYLNVSRPGENASRTILKSPHQISSYAISTDGQYAAYISTESGTSQLYLQTLSTGMRRPLRVVADADGDVRVSTDAVLYRSKKEDLSITLM
ncbi:MAG: hypothetical protein ABL931_09645, partial [Usitatibacteraceae bacterium]